MNEQLESEIRHRLTQLLVAHGGPEFMVQCPRTAPEAITFFSQAEAEGGMIPRNIRLEIVEA